MYNSYLSVKVVFVFVGLRNIWKEFDKYLYFKR